MTTPMEPQAHTRSGFIEAIADRVRAVLERMQAGWRERAPSCSLPQYSECDGHSDLSPLSAQKGGSMKFASDERRGHWPGPSGGIRVTLRIPNQLNWPTMSGRSFPAGSALPSGKRSRAAARAGRPFDDDPRAIVAKRGDNVGGALG